MERSYPYPADESSGKLDKALVRRAKGSDIQIISEPDFMELIVELVIKRREVN